MYLGGWILRGRVLGVGGRGRAQIHLYMIPVRRVSTICSKNFGEAARSTNLWTNFETADQRTAPHHGRLALSMGWRCLNHYNQGDYVIHVGEIIIPLMIKLPGVGLQIQNLCNGWHPNTIVSSRCSYPIGCTLEILLASGNVPKCVRLSNR